MKEATGELSTTVIAVVAIAAVLGIFTMLLLPQLKASINARMHCSDAVCEENCAAGSPRCTCWYEVLNDDGTSNGSKSVQCTNPDYQKIRN